MNWSKARKAIVAAVAAGVAIFVASISDGEITAVEWGAIASAVLVGGLTYATRNEGLPGGSEPPPVSRVGRPPL
jgi:hypothetical protein